MQQSRALRSARSSTIGAGLAVAGALLGLTAGPAGAVTPAHTVQEAYTVQDLGTLGGTTSLALAVDRHTVVGTSQITGNTATHAFAYDRRSGQIEDLGTLGGPSSQPVAVHGRYVIGNSTTAAATSHGFVYDLRRHTLTDIGTLGGGTSTVGDLSGHTVVGSSTTAGDTVTHGFVYDIRTHRMRDLGSLAGPAGGSGAGEILQGRWIVGNSTVPGQPASILHGYVYDLRTHARTDIGTHGAASSTVSDAAGHTVVGTYPAGSGTFQGLHGFAYDVRTGAWTDLGTNLFVRPLVGGHTVVGSDGLSGWAYDLRTGTQAQVGRTGVTEPKAISGDLAVGDYFAANSFAFAYRAGSATFTALPSLGGLNSQALAVDPEGAIAGQAATPPPDVFTANGAYHATLWTPQP